VARVAPSRKRVGRVQATQRQAGPSQARVPGEGETRAEFAYRVIRKDIIAGVRLPGEKLKVERLRQIYDIGPTPIREALQRLSAERLTVAEGNRGFTVAPLDAAEFNDLNIARTEVEAAALRRSLAQGDASWEAGVVAASYLMKKEDDALADAAAVPDSWEEANAAFHTALVSACGSRWLLRTRETLQTLCERYRRVSVRTQRSERDVGIEHAEIAEAVLARDVARAVDLTCRHFDLTSLSVGFQPAPPIPAAKTPR